MSPDAGVTYAFDCRACAESLEVNEPMKEALLANGCVVCGAPVTAAAFTRDSPVEPS
ncbi:MAG: hypothetical protein ABEJ61_05025 [Haloferacaceae archaeon]